MASGMTGPVLAQPTYHVAPDGSDMPSGGTAAQPWATIGYALQRVPSGALVLVAPGTYHGRIAVRGNFDPPVTVRSQVPYRAKLRHTGTVVTVYDDNDGVRGVHIEGFDIAHSGPGASALVVQVQSMGAAGLAGDIVFRDNILHDSWNNDILKINNGARRVQVLGNLFYNQSGSDEHIDINSVEAVLVEGNVFFNDFAASGRPVGNDTSSFIVIKDSNANDDGVVGARNVRIRRNIFLNWQGGAGANFLLCGEDGHPYHEAFDILVENNLFLDNSAVPMRAAFGSKGVPRRGLPRQHRQRRPAGQRLRHAPEHRGQQSREPEHRVPQQHLVRSHRHHDPVQHHAGGPDRQLHAGPQFVLEQRGGAATQRRRPGQYRKRHPRRDRRSRAGQSGRRHHPVVERGQRPVQRRPRADRRRVPHAGPGLG